MCRIAGAVGDVGVFARDYLRGSTMRTLAEHNPHGYGIGGFVDGSPAVHRSVGSAALDPKFGEREGTQAANAVVAHLRFATSGGASIENTHPFLERGRLIVHNGTFLHPNEIDPLLGADRANLIGETDTERFAALLSRNIDAAGGDTDQGYRETVAYLAEHHPMTSLTSAMTDASGGAWMLRYPENRTAVWRPMGAHADAAVSAGLLTPAQRTAAHDGPDLTVLASEPLDARGGWLSLQPGELLHVGADGSPSVRSVSDLEPRFRIEPDKFRDDPSERWHGSVPRAQVVVGDLEA